MYSAVEVLFNTLFLSTYFPILEKLSFHFPLTWSISLNLRLYSRPIIHSFWTDQLILNTLSQVTILKSLEVSPASPFLSLPEDIDSC